MKLRNKITALRKAFYLFEEVPEIRQSKLAYINEMISRLLLNLSQMDGIHNQYETHNPGIDPSRARRGAGRVETRGRKLVEDIEKKLASYGLVRKKVDESVTWRGWSGLEKSKLAVPRPSSPPPPPPPSSVPSSVPAWPASLGFVEKRLPELGQDQDQSQNQNRGATNSEQDKTKDNMTVAERVVIEISDDDEDMDVDLDEAESEADNGDCIITLVIDRKKKVEDSWVEMGMRLKDDLLWYDYSRDFDEALLP